jgi:pimeloyl-ACP methyl ester carboxylesterase
MPHVEITEGRVFYTRAPGPDGGPELVLVHGAGGSRLHWPAELRRMDGATVYSLDLPGHGRSEGPGRETIESYVSAVVDFLDQVGVASPVVVGHSMGGAVAQELALAEPERVSALVLVGTGARLRVDPAILKGIRHDFGRVVDLITEYAWSPDADPALKDTSREALRDAGPDVLLGDFLACDRFDVMERVGEIRLPTLLLVGSEDLLTPVKYSRFLAERIAKADLEVVERAGHMVMLEQPDAVGDAVRRFVFQGSRLETS